MNKYTFVQLCADLEHGENNVNDKTCGKKCFFAGVVVGNNRPGKDLEPNCEEFAAGHEIGVLVG